jgi:ComF family protein
MMQTSIGNDPICPVCHNIGREFDRCRSLMLYDNTSRKIILKIKKHADTEVAKTCARMLSMKYRSLFCDADFIVPVPSHWTRTLLRGYNPSRLIAIELSKFVTVPMISCLKRIRRTEYQSNKTIEEREINVSDAFACTKDLCDKRIILVDDVMTTGATLNECARILKMSGAVYVGCITIASTGINEMAS